jgi:hypothetical protein
MPFFHKVALDAGISFFLMNYNDSHNVSKK